MSSNHEDLLRVFLECGSCDLSVLDDVEYDLCEIVDELIADGVKPTLNVITNEIFLKGQSELESAVRSAINERLEAQRETDGSKEGTAEYDRLQSEIDDLETLNPYEDMGWYCNYLDTSCWLDRDHENFYRLYLLDEIRAIERSMGFEFWV